MNRVVLPLTGDYAENDHVLGHEIVHVFQYDIAVGAEHNNRRRFNLEQLPLWLVEGMAEYFSKGRIDPLTSMWIRDATHPQPPPRPPQADHATRATSRTATAKRSSPTSAAVSAMRPSSATSSRRASVGIEPAFDRVLGLSAKQVFADWQEAARELYNPVVARAARRASARRSSGS